MSFDEGWSIDPGPPTDYERSYVPLNRQPKKRGGTTPEAKVSKKIDDYLSLIGCINIRTNSGAWQDEHGNYIYGAKAGTSDKTLLLPGGRFCAVECKAGTNTLSDAQRRYKSRVTALGGLFIEARSVADLRAGLVAAFGEQTVTDWELLGKARKRR